jgi:hypothetical protein
MDDELALRVHLDLELKREPIAGLFRVEGETAVEFSGFLELVRLLDRAREAAEVASGASQP